MMAAIAPEVMLVDEMDFFLETGNEYLNETRVEVVTARNGQQDTCLPQIDRRVTRLPCQAEINLRRAGGAETMATSADLSASGMYVASQEPVAVGEIVRLYARFPRSIGAADISATVVWVNQGASRKTPSLPSGFGVKFTGLNVATRLIITQVLTKLSATSGSQRAIQIAV